MKWQFHILTVVLLALGLGLSTLACASAPPQPDEPGLERALAASVTVLTGSGSGSGVAFRNGPDTFVWTDAHVVASARRGPTLFYRVQLTQDDVEGGEKVGETSSVASVLRYSARHDLAVLKVHRRQWPHRTALFADKDWLPRPGLPIWHVGSMRGPVGAHSVSDGVIAAVGRMRGRDEFAVELGNPVVFDQISAVAHHGSSGGGVFRKDGVCIGLVVEFLEVGTPGSFCIAPARRMRAFAREMDCAWAIDDKVKAPKDPAVLVQEDKK